MRCQLCGYQFDASSLACHAGCPLGSHCNLICCPHCGYQVVNESKSVVAKFLSRFWPAAAEPATPTIPLRPAPKRNGETVVPLTHIPVGQEVEIEHFEQLPPERLAQLSAFGLIPGSRVALLQRSPAHILRLGETELALGKEILDHIWVRPGL